MKTAERRLSLLKLLCRRRFDTISNLASEFGVSERTIRRDISILMQTESIYTQSGRYGGGVYVVDNYTMDRMYFSEEELNAVAKMLSSAVNGAVCQLSAEEVQTVRKLIADYTKPKRQ